MEDYIKWKLIGKGSPRYLDFFSNLVGCTLHTYQHMLCIVATVDCTHVHHVVHYTHQHMLCIVATVDCTHVHHVVHYTHINTCYVLLLLLTAPMYTMLSTTHISIHAMYCCYC